MPGTVDRVDDFQRRHRVVGFPLAVVYKFFDDQGPYLAAIVTYYAFIAIFPLLLIATSLLGFILQGDQAMQERLLDTWLSRFPIVGTQLGRPGGLTGSASAVVVGSLAALYGVLGLGQAAQNVLNVAWAVPRNSRLNPIIGRVRSLLLLAVGGLTVVATSALTGFVSNIGSFWDIGQGLRLLSTAVSVLLVAVVLAVMMRYTTSRRPSFRTSLPGALAISVMWHGLQVVGGEYVRRVIGTVNEMNGIFALVLGLIALLWLAGIMAVLGVEINVVLNRRLWPRALLTPFTDAVRLTDADRRAYDSYAKAQRHKGFQHVEVWFDDRPSGPTGDDDRQASEPDRTPEVG